MKNNEDTNGRHNGSGATTPFSDTTIAWSGIPPQVTGNPRPAGEAARSTGLEDRAYRVLRELDMARAEIEEAIRQIRERLMARLQAQVDEMVAGIAADPKSWLSAVPAPAAANAPQSREARPTPPPSPSSSASAQVPKPPVSRIQGEPLPPQAPVKDPAIAPEKNGHGVELRRRETEGEAAKGPALTATQVIESPLAAVATLTAPDRADEELYEGTVHLDVNVKGCPQQTLQFVDELFQTPKFKVRRMVGDNKGKLDLWVGLREPVALGGVLGQMKSVSHVRSLSGALSADGDRTLSVWLAGSQPAGSGGGEMRASLAWGAA